MNGVYLCSSTNSTMFTECCGCAICDCEGHCPSCGQEIIGADCESEGATNRIRWQYAYKYKRGTPPQKSTKELNRLMRYMD